MLHSTLRSVSYLPPSMSTSPVFRLVQGVDVASTEAEVKAYEAANREQIAMSRARRVGMLLPSLCDGVNAA